MSLGSRNLLGVSSELCNPGAQWRQAGLSIKPRLHSRILTFKNKLGRSVPFVIIVPPLSAFSFCPLSVRTVPTGPSLWHAPHLCFETAEPFPLWVS